MTKQYIDELKPIIKHYKIKVYYSKSLPEWVEALSQGDNGFTISIKKESSKEKFISTFFHELGHIHCKRKGIWKSYHNPKNASVSKVRRTALKAELWVDKWAINEMKKWYPDLQYTGSYISMNRHHCKKVFYKNYLNKFYKNAA